ncbi:MAG: hypothetical protein ACPGVG_12555 [Mycobacterium sp.]
MNLVREDGVRVGASNVTLGKLTLKNASDDEVVNGRNDTTIITAGVPISGFDLTDTTDSDGNEVTVFGWDVATVESALTDAIANNLVRREVHRAELTLTYDQSGKVKVLKHRHRLKCVDAPSICTLEDIRELLGVDIPEVDDQGLNPKILYEAAIEATAYQAERVTGRHLRVSTSTETVRHSAARGQRRIRLKRYPLGTISEVKNAYSGQFASAQALTAETDYYPDGERGTIERLWADWLPGPGTIQVKHSGSGLWRSADDVDADVRHFAARNAKWLVDRKDSLGITSETIEGAAVASFVRGSMLPEFRDAMRELRRRSGSV